VNGKFNLKEVFEANKLRREKIKVVFGKPENELSHNDFIDMAIYRHEQFKIIFLELFYENPSHKIFNGLVPEDRSKLVQMCSSRRLKCRKTA
jgi:hypothetical protein